MGKHGFYAPCILVRVIEPQVDKTVGKADFGREFEQGIVHVEAAAVLHIENKNIGHEAVVINVIFFLNNRPPPRYYSSLFVGDVSCV